MDRELRDRWVKALRSGEYEQGSGQLRRGRHHYCCLGVLCEVMDVGYCGTSGFPAPKTYKAAGLDRDQLNLLASKNDAGNPFSEIADWIEANL